MSYQEIKRQIIDACLWLQDKELVVGTWGNISVKVDEGIILTPSRIDYRKMTIEDMVMIDLEGNLIEGFRSPTTEREVHRLIYRARSDVKAIVHYHPKYASAMCAVNEEIPAFTEEMTQLIGGSIPITPEYIRAGEHERLGAAAAKYLGQKNAVMLRNHAPVCCGENLDEALVCCQVVEKSALCYLALRGADIQIQLIPEKMIALENNRFKNDYGHEW